MLRRLALAALIALPTAAQAQSGDHAPAPGMAHHLPSAPALAASPREPGQAAFAAIQEIVALLVADSATDWSKVNVEALRRHLIDMDNVTLRAEVAATPLADGQRYRVTGRSAVRESIRRMVHAHAATMNGADGMSFAVEDVPDGAVVTVRVAEAAALPKLKALGFIGVMTLGMHHQAHHLMIAAGHGPHE